MLIIDQRSPTMLLIDCNFRSISRAFFEWERLSSRLPWALSIRPMLVETTALFPNSLSYNHVHPVPYILLNRLYKDTIIIISFTIFLNLVADTYSPNVLFSVEKAVSAIHLCPYFLFFFHLSRSLSFD
jgi:hypothetical protein